MTHDEDCEIANPIRYNRPKEGCWCQDRAEGFTYWGAAGGVDFSDTDGIPPNEIGVA